MTNDILIKQLDNLYKELKEVNNYVKEKKNNK